MDENWRNSVINSLKQRNLIQTKIYKPFLDTRVILFDENSKLKNKTNELEKLLSKYKHELAEIKNKENEIINKLKNEKDEMHKRFNKFKNLNNEKEKRLKEEIKTFRRRFEEKEEESRKLKDENNQLINRILQEKQKMMSEMNSMNNIVENINDLNKSISKSQITFPSFFKKKDEEKKNDNNNNNEIKNDNIDDEWENISEINRFNSLNESIPIAPLHILSRTGGEVYDIMLSKNGNSLISGHSDGMVRLWDTTSYRLLNTFRGSSQPMTCVDNYNELILGASNDNTCRVWNKETTRLKYHFTGHKNKIHKAKFSDNGNILFSAGADRKMRMWNVIKERSLHVFPSNSTFNSIDITYDNNVVISGHRDGCLRLWDVRSKEKIYSIKNHHNSSITSVSFSNRDVSTVLSLGLDNQIKLLDIRNYEELLTLAHPSFQVKYHWTDCSFSPSSIYIAAGSKNGDIFIWNTLSSDQEPIILSGEHNDVITSCNWNQGSLLSCDLSGSIIIWR